MVVLFNSRIIISQWRSTIHFMRPIQRRFGWSTQRNHPSWPLALSISKAAKPSNISYWTDASIWKTKHWNNWSMSRNHWRSYKSPIARMLSKAAYYRWSNWIICRSSPSTASFTSKTSTALSINWEKICPAVKLSPTNKDRNDDGQQPKSSSVFTSLI